VHSGDEAPAGDFGSFKTASISGKAFTDENGNGMMDPAEQPRAGVVVFLDLNGNGVQDAGEPSAVTGTDGSYTIDGARPGTVSVVETGLSAKQITVGSGEVAGKVDFARAAAAKPQPKPAVDPRTGSIEGTVWGVGLSFATAKSAARHGVRNQLVWLDVDNDRKADSGEPRRRTNAAGHYSFGSLPAGRYVVRLLADRSAGWTCQAPTGCLHVVALAAAQRVVLRDFSDRVPQPALSMRATQGCRDTSARTLVSGRFIASVTFVVDGKRAATLRRANAGSGRFRLNVRMAGRRAGVHRVSARVTFAAATQLASRTLRASLYRCQPRPSPKYTG
jgi:hypothetical protein